jgi:radical SAM protein with 4Fe4S-binding SPASM domain
MGNHRLHLNVTDRCNLRCVHCYWEEYGAHGDPSLEQIDGILARFKRFTAGQGEIGQHTLTLGGGEPTLRADLEEIVRLGVRRGFDIRLVTNAVTIDDARARALHGAGVRAVQVSLDGATAATHEAVRGNGTWARTMRGIAAFRAAGVLQVLSYVLLPGVNIDEAPALLDLANQLEVAGVKFARPIDEGQASANDVATEGDHWSTFVRILTHAKAIDYRRLLLFFDPLAHLLPVEHPRQTEGLIGLATDLCQCDATRLVEIDAGSGKITYCRIRQTLGNIYSDDLATVWANHPILTGIRGKTAAGSCDGCSVFAQCRGGCPAVTIARTGSVLPQDPDCHKATGSGDGPAPVASIQLLPLARLRRRGANVSAVG